jgi:hypothetical protein
LTATTAGQQSEQITKADYRPNKQTTTKQKGEKQNEEEYKY